MAKLITVRFEDDKDGDFFLDKLQNKGWHVAVSRDSSEGRTGEPDEDNPGWSTIVIGPTSVDSVEDAPDNRAHPYWAEKEATGS